MLSVKQWVEKTNSRGIITKAGRYGGMYAHKDIAFEFASWVSPQFKLYLILEMLLKLAETATIRNFRIVQKGAADQLSGISGGFSVYSFVMYYCLVKESAPRVSSLSTQN